MVIYLVQLFSSVLLFNLFWKIFISVYFHFPLLDYCVNKDWIFSSIFVHGFVWMCCVDASQLVMYECELWFSFLFLLQLCLILSLNSFARFSVTLNFIELNSYRVNFTEIFYCETKFTNLILATNEVPLYFWPWGKS